MNLPGFTAEQALLTSVSYQTETGTDRSASVSAASPEAFSGNRGRVVPAMSWHCTEDRTMCCALFSNRYCCCEGGSCFCDDIQQWG